MGKRGPKTKFVNGKATLTIRIDKKLKEIAREFYGKNLNANVSRAIYKMVKSNVKTNMEDVIC